MGHFLQINAFDAKLINACYDFLASLTDIDYMIVSTKKMYTGCLLIFVMHFGQSDERLEMFTVIKVHSFRHQHA